MLYYPRCLENKVVVFEQASWSVLLCHQAILLLVCFSHNSSQLLQLPCPGALQLEEGREGLFMALSRVLAVLLKVNDRNFLPLRVAS